MIKLTLHAEIRLSERDITKDLVETTIENPDFTLPGRGNRKIAIKVITHRFLKAVFVKENSDIIVITAHWISRFKQGRQQL